MSGTRRVRSGVATVVSSSPWVLVSIGVVVMVVLLLVALGAYRGRAPGAALPGADATMPLPELPPSSADSGPPSPSRTGASATPPPAALPRLSPRSSVPPVVRTATPLPPATGGAAGDAPPTTTPAPPSTPAASAPPPAPPAVTGRYQVLETFDDAFIGEVLVSNAAGEPRAWTVRLTFPVGELVTAWIEGAPQGGVSRSGDTWTFTSGEDLASGASVPLRFHFERTGGATSPSGCSTDGAACTGG
ncbi:cellulose binding domain-containing protein [Micromonospora mirobrigensis]|uniref:Cellulose binding domain-containing protein n=1 Tax=Micromonospora mirobrigensis TaxID=262898 RepID=A0A1C4X6L8_9ACTN|nr:cellulose binding domain-containing protein [Micromonospora mirobrigensis]SCF04103.1 Cellulose binding domain-containing protein [Micromonospora mirobrigensis]